MKKILCVVSFFAISIICSSCQSVTYHIRNVSEDGRRTVDLSGKFKGDMSSERLLFVIKGLESEDAWKTILKDYHNKKNRTGGWEVKD